MATTTDSFHVGDKNRIWFTCKRVNLDGTKELADPTLLSVVVKQEDETEDTWTAVAWPTDGVVHRYSLGVFYYEYPIAKSGLFFVVPKATGAITVAALETFNVADDPTA